MDLGVCLLVHLGLQLEDAPEFLFNNSLLKEKKEEETVDFVNQWCPEKVMCQCLDQTPLPTFLISRRSFPTTSDYLQSQETSGTDPALKNLVTKFRAKLQQCGMKVGGDPAKTLVTPSLQKFQDASREVALVEIRKVIVNALKNSGNNKPSFILVFLSTRDNYSYPGIRVEPSAMEWLTKDKTMMVGIDVTHPGLTSRVGSPSIATVVVILFSWFAFHPLTGPVQFPASLRIQKPDVNRESKDVWISVMGMNIILTIFQMVTELDMLVERLLVYEKRNKFLPERVIVLRDGVSEGQFDIVVREEKAQILEASATQIFNAS
ncbi:hypothetical protein B0H13DRAFT_2429219 [Mycena leptocephala]|nr:hypothetical protein B0H13DRAFT_2429219 [Mycena leptocephala]